jgi:HK97 family phage major capsid protein
VLNLLDLQQQKQHKVLTAKDIREKAEKAEGGPRPFTEDENQIIDRLVGEIGRLDEQIAAVQATTRRQEQIGQLLDDLERPQPRLAKPDEPAKPKGGDGASLISARRIPATAYRTGKLQAFKGPDAEERAYRAGMWALAVIWGNAKAQQWCLNNGVGGDIRAAMSTTSNTEGGFLVPEEMARTIIDLREEYGVFRRNARVWPMGSDTLVIPRRTGGVTIGAIAENPSSAITDSTPTGDTVMLVAKKAGGLVKLSSEIEEDAVIDLGDWIAREFAWGFALFEDQCGFIGDGTSTYLGIRGLTNLLTEASGMAGAVLAAAGHDTFAEIDASDLANVMGVLPQFATMNAKWYCSRVAAEMIFGRLQAVAGGNTVGTLSGERAGRSYLGYPIEVSQVLPTSTGTINGTAMAFFGDLSKSSALGDRRRLRIFRSEHRFMDTDQIGITGTERFDIVNHDVGSTTAAGPIVALIGNT